MKLVQAFQAAFPVRNLLLSIPQCVLATDKNSKNKIEEANGPSADVKKAAMTEEDNGGLPKNLLHKTLLQDEYGGGH